MSWHVVGPVSKRVIGDPIRKLILMTMADKANEDGTGVFASVATLAGLSETHPDTIRRTLREFQDRGLIKLVGTRKCVGGATRVYDLQMDAIEALPLVTSWLQRATTRSEQPLAHSDKGTRSQRVKPILEPTLNLSGNRSVELESESVVGAQAKPSPKSKKKIGWTAAEESMPSAPSEKMVEYAKAKIGWAEMRARLEFEKFRNNYIMRSRMVADLDRCWMNWVLTAKSHAQEREAKFEANPKPAFEPFN